MGREKPWDEVGYRSVTQQGFEVIRDDTRRFDTLSAVTQCFAQFYWPVPKNILRVAIFDMLLLTKRFSKATVN